MRVNPTYATSINNSMPQDWLISPWIQTHNLLVRKQMLYNWATTTDLLLLLLLIGRLAPDYDPSEIAL